MELTNSDVLNLAPSGIIITAGLGLVLCVCLCILYVMCKQDFRIRRLIGLELAHTRSGTGPLLPEDDEFQAWRK